MKKILLLTFLLSTFASLAFAQKSETRDLKSFDRVEVSGSMDVWMEKGKSNKVEIVCKGDYEVDDIETRIDNGRLRIKYKDSKGWNWGRSGSVKITLTYSGPLTSVSSSGSSDIVGNSVIKTDNLKLSSSGSGDMDFKVDCNTLEVHLSGSSDIDLVGKAKEADIHLSGSSDVEALGLETELCEISVSGSGDVKVSVSREIKGNVSGSGNITYKGRPERQKIRVSGSGDIEQIN